jgi:hypothetical protein
VAEYTRQDVGLRSAVGGNGQIDFTVDVRLRQRHLRQWCAREVVLNTGTKLGSSLGERFVGDAKAGDDLRLLRGWEGGQQALELADLPLLRLDTIFNGATNNWNHRGFLQLDQIESHGSVGTYGHRPQR